MNGYKAPIAIHPGETLKEIIESLNMSQAQLSDRTGLHTKTINEIIKGKSPITPDTALKLSIVFGMSESFWNNLQKNFEEVQARISLDEELENELDFARNFTCYNELVKYNYIKMADEIKQKARNLLDFLGVTSFKLLENNYSIACRRSLAGNLCKENLIAWLRCGEITASKIKTKPYNNLALKSKLKEIRSLNLLEPKEYSGKLRDLLAECGVAISYVPYFKNTYVNGATRWLNPEKVLIILTPRCKFEDILWFTLFHELCHVLKHNKSEGFISFWGENDLAINNKNIEYEVEADNFSAETLIPTKQWKEFQNMNKFNGIDIIKFAEKVGIKPGIVGGRLAKETGKWNQFMRFRKKIEVISDKKTISG